MTDTKAEFISRWRKHKAASKKAAEQEIIGYFFQKNNRTVRLRKGL